MVRDDQDREDVKWTFWFKARFVLEVLIGLLVIWIACTIFTGILMLIATHVFAGKSVADCFDVYGRYIQIGYGAVISICFALYIQRLYKKYKIKANGNCE